MVEEYKIRALEYGWISLGYYFWGEFEIEGSDWLIYDYVDQCA